MISLGGRAVVGFGGAACPGNPAPRAGYTIWKGGVPQELVQWAVTLRDNIRDWPYGQEWTMRWNDMDVMARKDHHTWTYQNGALKTGLCIPGITLYKPVAKPAGALSAADVVDPATVSPDPALALYSVSATPPPEKTNWLLVGVSASALATVAGLFALSLHAIPPPARRGAHR